jgi:hypothetical protein
MNSKQKYYEDSTEKAEEKLSKNVQEIADLVELLSPIEKVQIKKLLKNLEIF